MLSVSYERAVENSPDAGASALAEIAGLMREARYPDALRRLLTEASFESALNTPDWVRESCFYYFALFCLRAGRRDLFQELSAVTGPLRSDTEVLEYGEHRRRVGELLPRQRAAVEAGAPSILILSLPKSASAFVSNALADMLGLAPVRLDYDDGAIDDGLLRHFALGGCVTHNHLPATARNLAALRRLWAGRPVFIQLRDPRAAIWSMHHHVNGRRRKACLEEVVAAHYGQFVDWIDGWLSAQELVSGVELVRFEQVAADAEAVFRRILERCGAPSSALDDWKARGGSEAAYNLRSGDPDEWRRALPADLQDRLRQATPRRVLDFFEA